MNLLVTYLKRQKSLIYFAFLVNLVIIIIFSLFKLDSKLLAVCLGLIDFALMIILGVGILAFKQENTVQEKLIKLQSDYNLLYDEKCEFQDKLQDYFLLWVHQIKTPITSLRLMAEGGTDWYLPTVKQELIAIENYANMAMSYLKLLAPGQDLNFEEVDLNMLIQEQLRKFSVWFIHDKIQLIYDAKPYWVLTDPRWTAIQIEQLLSNAVKYSRGKSIEITFDEKYQTLWIKDTGCGISQADLPKIFERGYSGFNGQLNEKASGIGLYIVNSIAKKINQPVKIESQLGHGTQASITFNKN